MSQASPSAATRPIPVERVTVSPAAAIPGARWVPVIGEETYRLLDRLGTDIGQEGASKLRDEAVRILAKCAPPHEANSQTTGLALGQVQSGKTMSFTTVAALARDNGYRIVIVITGTTTSLLDQSAGRLRRDLGLDEAIRCWKHIPVLPARPLNRQTIVDALDEWDDPRVGAEDKPTLLVTVMKNHKNLRKLREVLETIPLEDVPTLVIDDEGDQASLNTKVRSNAESTTYRELVALKRCLHRHTFLQYTATPQALLLVNIINVLSPRFCALLEPGGGYTGGKSFFIDRPELVREIPANEIGTRQNPLTEPPESIHEAMRLFFLGVAAGQPNRDGGNRSMLVHPSVTTAEHARFFDWITLTKESWKQLLSQPDNSPDRRELIAEFEQSYGDLRATVPNLPPFAQLADELLPAIRRTQVEKVNAVGGQTPRIAWNDAYAFILVGGTAMDRGFTVRGLTVTYMPRVLGGGGQGNADTVQQRGRFFGYKEQYLGLCRVFLEAGVLQAFREYVEHEEDVRERIASHNTSGRALTEWPRAFVLDVAMKPTRDDVIDVAYRRQPIGPGWFVPKAPHVSIEAVQHNRLIRDELLRTLQLTDDEGHPDRTEFTRHSVARAVRLADVYERFLAGFRLANYDDSGVFLTCQLLIRQLLDTEPDVTATVYLMSKGHLRQRTADEDDEIPTLFQGAVPVTPKIRRGSIYPGDAEIREQEGITLQLHNLEVARPGGRAIGDVPMFALWLPTELARHLVIQPQGGPT